MTEKVVLAIAGIFIILYAIKWGLLHGSVDFYPLNGDFQTYNGVHRILNEQIPFRDFYYYLGFGPLALTSLPLIFVKSFYWSKVITAVGTVLLIGFFYFGVNYYAMNKNKELAAVLTAVYIYFTIKQLFGFEVMLTATSLSIRVYRLIIVIIAAFGASKIFLYFENKNMKFQVWIKNIIYASLIALCMIWSNDFGISSGLMLSVLILAEGFRDIIQKKQSWKLASLHIVGTYCIAILFIDIFLVILTQNHVLQYFNYAKGVAYYQFWYYIPNAKVLNLLGIIQEINIYEFTVLAWIIYLFVKIMRREDLEKSIFEFITASSIFLSYYMYYLNNMNKGYNFILAILLTIYVINLYVKKIILGNDFFFKNIIKIRLLVFSIILLSSAWLFTTIMIINRETGSYVTQLGGYATKWGDEYPVIQKIIGREKLWSTYASAHEVILNQFQPSGYDYIIHVLGDQARSNYLKKFETLKPKYIEIPWIDGDKYWSTWALKANWFFYRNIFKDYYLVRKNYYSVLFKRKMGGGIIDAHDIEFQINGNGSSDIKLILHSEQIKKLDAIADIQIKYFSETKSPFIFRWSLAGEDDWNDIHIDELKNFGLPAKYEGAIPVRMKNGNGNFRLFAGSEKIKINITDLKILDVYVNQLAKIK